MRDKKLHPKLTLAIIVALVILTALTAFVWAKQQARKNVVESVSTTQAAQEAPKSNSISYAGEDGKNAMELLKAKADVVTKQSSYGEYVDSINGVQGGAGGKYWAFYVNGQMAQVGAADYQTKDGDRIEWKFE